MIALQKCGAFLFQFEYITPMKDVRNFFENIKTFYAELIGLIGGFFWGRRTNWDYEPLLLVIVSGTGLLISILLLIFKVEITVKVYQHFSSKVYHF